MRNATKLKRLLDRYDVNVHRDDDVFKMVIIHKETNSKERFEAINFSDLLNKAFRFMNSK